MLLPHHHHTSPPTDADPTRLAVMLAYARAQAACVAVPVSLYVKNLPSNADELWLYKAFAPFGAITSVRALRDRDTTALRGVGFVNYVDATAAQAAMAQLNAWPVDGRRLSVELQRAQRSPVRRALTPTPNPPAPPQPLPPPPPRQQQEEEEEHDDGLK